MNEIIPDVDSWLVEANFKIALATVIQTWGSAPRKTGAKMAVTADGRIAGSVSGGCVEGAVIAAALETLETQKPQLLHFGVADETAWEVGLACGGIIDVFVEPLNETTYQFARERTLQNKPGSIGTIIKGSTPLIGEKVTFDGQKFWYSNDDEVANSSMAKIIPDIKKSKRIAIDDNLEIFVDYLRPSPTLIVVGGVHVAIALTNMAKMLKYQTVIIDPRRSFGNEARFPHVDALIQKWPQKAFEELELTGDTAVTLLTHDPKIDDPALRVLLESPVFYIGALGSKKTHAKRKERLKKMGFTDSKIARIHAPIGLDIGADTPEEIALAIMSEIVGTRHA